MNVNFSTISDLQIDIANHMKTKEKWTQKEKDHLQKIRVQCDKIPKGNGLFEQNQNNFTKQSIIALYTFVLAKQESVKSDLSNTVENLKNVKDDSKAIEYFEDICIILKNSPEECRNIQLRASEFSNQNVKIWLDAVVKTCEIVINKK